MPTRALARGDIRKAIVAVCTRKQWSEATNLCHRHRRKVAVHVRGKRFPHLAAVATSEILPLARWQTHDYGKGGPFEGGASMTILQLLTPMADVSWLSATDTVRDAFDHLETYELSA